MPISEDNQAIVDAINRKIGNINTLYSLSISTILIMLLLAIIGYFSISQTNRILEEFVSEVRLNTKDREQNALMSLAIRDLTNTVARMGIKLDGFIQHQTRTNENVMEFNNKHSKVLDTADDYIKQHPIELLRKGK